jgi:hypothetical protein
MLCPSIIHSIVDGHNIYVKVYNYVMQVDVQLKAISSSAGTEELTSVKYN